jgi:chaperonin GroES
VAANKKKTKVKAKAKSKAPVKKAAVKKKAAPAKKTKSAVRAKTFAAPKISNAALQKILTPLDDRILISVEGASEVTAGGIIIPGTVAQRPNRGKVLATGRGRRSKKGQLRPLDVNVGDTVLYPEHAGTPVTLQGAEFLILREEDVLGITN